MRTKVFSLLLACLGVAIPLHAQQNAASRANAPGATPPTVVSNSAAATLDPAAPAEPERPIERPRTVATSAAEILPLISFAAEYPLIDAITNLAQQANLNFAVAPELLTNGTPANLLKQPVGIVRFENLTARQALDSLLAQKSLLLGTRADANGTLLGTLDSRLAPLPADAGDLGAVTPPNDQQDLDMLFDPNKEVPLITAIQMLARLAKLNVLIDPRVKTGGIRQVGTNIVELPPVATNTVSLSTYGGVSPRQTLEAVLNNYGLTLLTDPKTGFSQVTFRDPGAKEPVYTYTVPLRYSNTTNIQTLIQSTFPTARVQSDQRTAQLVVLSTQREYDAITNLVASLDTPTKQVLIEARFLETVTNPKSVKGIDWTDTFQAQRFTMGNGSLTAGKTTTTTTKSPGDALTFSRPDGTRQSVTPGSSSSTTSTDTKTTSFDSTTLSLSTAGGFAPNVAFLNAQGVNAVLSFLNSESDSRIIATPRVTTLDNQETRLEVTTAIPIFNNSDAIGQAGTQVSSSRPEYTNVGTILIVTPRITGTNVAMKVKPEISKVLPEPSRKVVQGKINEADIFATSKIETHVIVPSGNTLVMGGLISDRTEKGYTKVPFFGDIPGLGWAFRKESKNREKANLIIFLTPTIIEDSDFQPHRTEFLNTKLPEPEEAMPKYWDRGKPYEKVKREKANRFSDGDDLTTTTE
jgi:Flp pilus assembly secretin CpaC